MSFGISMPKLYLKRFFNVIKPTGNSTCKSMILVRIAAILFLCKFGIQTQTKLSENDIYLFSLQKYELKANF